MESATSPLTTLEQKEKRQKLKEEDRVSISDRIPWSSVGDRFVEIALSSAWASDLSQIEVMPMEPAWRRASLIAKASAIMAEDTCRWVFPPLLISPPLSLRIHPVPEVKESFIQAPSVLQVIEVGGRANNLIVSYIGPNLDTWYKFLEFFYKNLISFLILITYVTWNQKRVRRTEIIWKWKS